MVATSDNVITHVARWTTAKADQKEHPADTAMNRTLRSTLLLSRACWTTNNPHLCGGFYVSTVSPVPTSLSSSCSYSSNIKVRSYLQYVKRKIKPPPSPPYPHVCQVGDPVLRCHAAPVDASMVQGSEVQEVIATMVKVMRKLQCVGLSAPQVGVPLRILALEFPESMLEDVSPAAREARGVSVVPLRVFINPQLRVLDGRTVVFQEACESISGFSASVPRYVAVEVSGLNEKAEPVTWQANGWPARIVQHEMDHLDGVLYIDRMDSKTFINVRWEEHNE